jgi:hypothetical protein
MNLQFRGTAISQQRYAFASAGISARGVPCRQEPRRKARAIPLAIAAKHKLICGGSNANKN